MKKLFLVFLFCFYGCIQLAQIAPMTVDPLPGSERNDYLIASMVFNSANAAFTTMNVFRMTGGDSKRVNAGFSILSGIAQLTLPLMTMPHDPRNAGVLTSMNVGMGLVTVGTGVWRLLKKPAKAGEKVACNFGWAPLPGNRYGVAAAIRIKID